MRINMTKDKSSKKFILAIDMGTTAFKGALFDIQGNEVAHSTREYSIIADAPGHAEVHVSTYLNTFRQVVKGVLDAASITAEQVLTIGLSSQCETSIFLDSNDKPLRNAIVWFDTRAKREASDIVDAFGSATVQKHTGQVGEDAIWPGAKLLWLKRHEPDVFNNTRKVLQLNSYIKYVLTGVAVAEDSMLGSTVYFDVTKRKYWSEMLDFIGITENQLPEIVTPGSCNGKVTEGAAMNFGLAVGTPVSIGGTDLACGAIGTGNLKPGDFSDSTGSSLCTMTMVDHLICDPLKQMPCYCSAIPGMFMVHAYAAGGLYMRWFRDLFGEKEMEIERNGGMNAYDQFDELAAQIPAGSNGLIALPHLQGSGPPDTNPNAKACFIGMTLAHDKRHFTRAIMESVTMALRRIIDATESLGVKVDKITSLGGGAYSPIWCQIKADATARTVVTTKNHEIACCLGAAILAGVSCGLWPSIKDACMYIIKEDKVYNPNLANKPIYDELLQNYMAITDALAPIFK